jgi:DNA-binding transcriptional regulator YiaG
MRTKLHKNMNSAELIAVRRTLGLNKTQMAATLRTPYRTYQEWENGGRRIPGIAQVAMELLQQKDRWVMAAIKTKIERGFGQ